MRACGQKLVKFCTLTHAAKLVVEIRVRTYYLEHLQTFAAPLFGCEAAETRSFPVLLRQDIISTFSFLSSWYIYGCPTRDVLHLSVPCISLYRKMVISNALMHSGALFVAEHL